jgi:hypothetical protein
MKPRGLYNAWMPLVVVISLAAGAILALRPCWRPAGDRELVMGTRPKLSGEGWVEQEGPTWAVFRAGAPFTAFTATADLEMPRVAAGPPGMFRTYCYEYTRAVKAVAVYDGQTTGALPMTLCHCEVVPKRVHPAGLVGNFLFISALCATFGWSLLFAATRRPGAEPGRCVCGYDLAGLPETVCPECGVPTTPPPPAALA